MNREDVTVSVVVPAYDAADYITRCLRSIFGQIHTPAQVIVVDDGSQDATAKIVQTEFPQVTYCHQNHSGPAQARNVGMEQSTGSYVAFLDADDYWEADFLSSCVRFLESHTEAIAVSTGRVLHTWNQTHHISTAVNDIPNPEAFVISDFFAFWAEHDHIRTGSCLIRRAVIEQAGGMRSHLITCEDLEYWGYLATFGPWGFIPEPHFVNVDKVLPHKWLEKRKYRCSVAPSVTQWQERILPRLKEEDWPGFLQVQGRIAKGCAHDRIMSHDDTDAFELVRTYGQNFPCGHVSRIMKISAKAGKGLWKLGCHILRCREYVKAMILLAIYQISRRRNSNAMQSLLTSQRQQSTLVS